ncbi:bifunctional transcriptional activator/DNA repair enzyme AdaA [Aeromonas hydrophila]|uniref:methylated-DNA--[protein]-cysteine S-methyltransferase n=1 Tax=Aeromonas hydrophila subsp. hydrophila (strain ATCC 7966 / DSM 30187 / BCRC 13018 / CCUG 14551 / JCM 1027 / KCTC 2358 / NCIMB 9240 / NCTC 8049) TaxID=380703 RepID=A0KJS3_AERHH|nr:methylated-DNA--[protein]-cysteine S-methyltransferase [Aeromonas hydrophila]ABK38590.1 ada regulatory protein [Aeromonas hydrophila subsp. hydrophila ATCC 7966]MBS4671202.1 methylated-DNA--[protein]-cysteine S-methyltransferase [Aeromonas hydrophila]OOD31592.1 6-O-methylguanine DNA methyltransferase [Aeromonas hydrophila]SUU26761.1 ada regulatory protein [Aeromonas hydrophila]
MSDYARIADAIRFIASQVARQPTLDEIAAHVHLSPFHFQRLFSRWAGVTPKRYLQVLTLERAKALLQESRPLLEVADTLGLSSGSRLYDHFVQLEAVTPGEYKQRGAGLVIDHGVHDTPFGQAFVALTPRGVCNFSFLDDQNPQAPLAALAHSWPEAELREAPSRTRGVIHTMFDTSKAQDRPISLHVSGTNFQISVWRALLQIPPAKVVSYAQVASAVGNHKAARAVGLAVGANPVALMIPCHRVIQQNGKLGGYHWGETRKQAIHAWEAARYE